MAAGCWPAPATLNLLSGSALEANHSRFAFLREMFAPVPDIVVEDAAPPSPKRRRLSVPTSVCHSIETVSCCFDGEVRRESHFTSFNAETHGNITEDTLVCFGMVSQT